MEEDLVARIKANPNYHALVKQRSTYGWILTAVMMVVYYGYILLIAFDKELLAKPIGDGVMTWGIPVGIFVLVFTILITALYVWRANSVFDDLAEQVRREVI